MRVRSSKKKEIIDKQQIINYQYKMIELSLPLVEPVISNTSKYVPWELESKIKETIGQLPYTIRWIGNSETAYLETYAYIMLIGTGQSEANILQFKYTIYKLGKKCLQLAEQKLLVEFLCLIEYSRDKYSFLNKYPQIEAIFIKILQYLQEEHTYSDDSTPESKQKAKVKRKYVQKIKSNSNEKKDVINQNNSHRSNSLSQELEYEKQLQQIYQSFNKYFEFITLLGSNECSCTFKLFDNKKIYVVIQKECYFMVEPLEKNSEEMYNLNLGNNRSKTSNRAQNSNSQQRVPSLNDSSVGNFDKKQFLDIFNYKSEVQQSNVISIERGSQIRKPSTANLLENLSNANTPKFKSTAPQQFECPQEFQIQKNEEKIENDRTFIDQLLNNVVLQCDNELNKSVDDAVKSEIAVKKKKLMEDKMKNILTIKQELKLVRMRIQDKIRLIDQAQSYQTPQDIKFNSINPTSEKLQTSKSKFEQKEKQFKNNIVKEFVVKKHEKSIFLKKQRKTSYNSVKIIPYESHFQRFDDNLDAQSPTLPKNRKSANPYMHRMERMLSEKAASRPHSNFKSIIEQEAKHYQRSKSPEPQRMKNQYNIRSLSPKNVNVNVNVNINENLLNPIGYQQTSFPISYQQLYHKKHKMQHYTAQYYIPSQVQKQFEGKAKFPPFFEKLKNNPESSFYKSNKSKCAQLSK